MRLVKHGSPPFLVLLLVQAILFTNVLVHDPSIGYDGGEHLRYIEALSKLRLPSRDDTSEFFSPPLPYAVPALLRAAGLSIRWAAKAGQLINLACSLGLCLCMLKICDLVRPKCARLRFWSLALLAIVPAYYKSFSMVRGEPLLSLLIADAVFLTLRAYRTNPCRARDFVSIGVLLGLAVLARQWAFFVFPAIAFFALFLPAPNWKARLLNLKPLFLSFSIAAAIGSWFYVSLEMRYGRLTSFNRLPAVRLSIANQPREFYVGLGLGALFSDPIRPAFPNEFIPIFYSEFWGDYECYFVVYGKDRRNGQFYSGSDLEQVLKEHGSATWLETNRFRIAPFLGYAQTVALLPSVLFTMGFAFGIASLFREQSNQPATALLALVTLASFLGYFAFLILYPNLGKGDTIKATYMLQVFPLLAVLGADLLVSVRDRSSVSYHLLAALLAVSAALNAPLLFTRYVGPP